MEKEELIQMFEKAFDKQHPKEILVGILDLMYTKGRLDGLVEALTIVAKEKK